ncbi:nucleoside deaminase [Candidatus Poribacteria bacterium]|nr:nucleoside deaminase [Candidatus Poribacteria bacterium]
MAVQESLTTHCSGVDFGSAMTESHPGVGRRISLREMAAYYFPEETYPLREQMYEKLLLFSQLLAQADISLYMAPDTILPFLEGLPVSPLTRNGYFARTSDFQDLDPRSSAYNLLMKITGGPKFTLFDDCEKGFLHKDRLRYTRNTVIKALKDATMGQSIITDGEDILRVEEVKPDEFGLSTETTQVFRMLNEKDKVSLKALGCEGTSVIEEEPLIIVEEGCTTLGVPYFSLRLAVDTKNDHLNVQSFSPLRTLFTLEIRSKDILASRDTITNWDNDGVANWIVVTGEPYVYFPDNSLRVFREPMYIDAEDFINLRGSNSLVERDPKSFMELVMTAAKMVNEAVISENNIPYTNRQRTGSPTEPEDGYYAPAISAETLGLFRKEFVRIGNLRESRTYTPLQIAIYHLLGQGIDVCKDLDYFTFLMAKAARQNWKKFLQYFTAIGLDKLLPTFTEIQDQEGFTGEPDLVKIVKAFDLLPDLASYLDHRPSKEEERRDASFMKICLIGALRADETGEESFGSLIAKDRRVITVACNMIEELHDPTQHAEVRAMAQAQKILGGDRKLEGCELYTTVEPCTICAGVIRMRSGIKRVVCGIESPIMGSETRYRILTDPALANLGDPFGEPPSVVFGVLREEVSKHYQKVGYGKMFPNLS